MRDNPVGKLLPWWAWLIVALILLVGMILAGVPAHAESPRLTKTQLGELAADTAIRSLDAYSTQRAAHCACNHETVYPDFISKHGVRLWSFSALVPAFNYQTAKMLDKRGHHRLSKLVYAVDISLEVPAVIGNMGLRTEMPKGMVVLKGRTK